MLHAAPLLVLLQSFDELISYIFAILMKKKIRNVDLCDYPFQSLWERTIFATNGSKT